MGWVTRGRSLALVAAAALCGWLCGWIAPGAAEAQGEAGVEPGDELGPDAAAEPGVEVEPEAGTADDASARPRPRDETDSPILTVPDARRDDPDARPTYEHVALQEHETPPRSLRGPPSRSLGARYTDALAGSWAGTGLMVLGAAVTSITFGLAVGCSIGGGFGCAIGALYGSMGGGLGWFLGPGIGTARGAGLEPGEAFVAWALGVLSNGAVIAISVGIGVGIDSASGFGSSGLGWGIATGTVLGGLVQVFLTPLYAVTMYEDRPEATPSIGAQPIPFAAPVDGGLVAGVGGAF